MLLLFNYRDLLGDSYQKMDDEPFGVDLIRIHFGLLCSSFSRVILAVVVLGPPYQDDPSGSLGFWVVSCLFASRLYLHFPC